MQKLNLRKPEHMIFLIFFFFSIICAICFIMSSDDFLWTAYSSISDMIKRDNQNGRFFTNSITYLMVNFLPLRVLLYVFFMIVSFFSFKRIIDSEKVHGFSSAMIVFLGFLTLDKGIANSTLRWISGFTNYVISASITCISICFFQALFSGKELKTRKPWAVLLFIMGLAGSLCLENMAIYNFIMGLFFLFFSIRKTKNVNFIVISFLIGTIIGIIIMFSHFSYHSIFFDNKDILGYRSIDKAPIDIIYKVYRELIPFFAKKFFFVHFLIAGSMITIYIRRSAASSTAAPKYLEPSIFIITVFAVYSLFTVLFENLVSLSPSYRTASIETAFTALYIFALIYACYHLLDNIIFIKAMFLLVSVLIVTAPFLFVNPVSSRCFYNVFVFWFLFAGVLAVHAFEGVDIRNGAVHLKRISVCLVLAFTILSSYISINNKYIDNCRLQYLNTQLEQGAKNIYLLKLPYPAYSPDTLLDRLRDPANVYYYRLICNYYGFDSEIAEKNIIELDTVDYYQLKDLE